MTQSKKFFLFFLLAATITCLGSACGVPTGSIQSNLLNSSDSDSFLQITSIKIEDDWSGYSPVSPKKAHYSLQRQTNQFSGTAKFSACRDLAYRSETEAVTIPINVVQKFLQMLTTSPLLVENKYEPMINHTDDYPSLSIKLETETGLFSTYYTQSQGINYVPWAAKINGTNYVINSDIPAQALKILEPHLKKEQLKNLVDECLKFKS